MLPASFVASERLQALEADIGGGVARLWLVRFLEAELATEQLLALDALDRDRRHRSLKKQ